MKAKISFLQPNPEYSQEYADTYQNGEESENNRKYIIHDKIPVDEVKKTHITENGIITLRAKFVDTEKELTIEIPDMYIVEFIDNYNFIHQFAVSNSIKKDFTYTKRGLKYSYFYFEIKKDAKVERLEEYPYYYFSPDHMSRVLAQLQ